MKKLFVLFAFMGLVAFTANAQSCGSKKATSAKSETACCAKTAAAAAKLASMDESIESKTCAKSGKVSYTKKEVCAKSGKVSYTDVEYCTKSGKFVNMSPKDVKDVKCTKSKASCGDKAKASKAKATKVSSTTKKSCAAPKSASAGACGGSKAASAKAVKVSASAKKACTPEEMAKCKKTCTPEEIAACKAKKAASANASTDDAAKVKLVSNKGEEK